jgi:polar amino acid transport system substrate-binding protein
MVGKAILLALGVVATGSSAALAQGQPPLVTGVDGTFAPHAMPRMGGGVEGFNVDLAEEIGKRLGRKVEILSQEFSGLIPGLNAKKLDFIGAPVTVTAERAKTLLFTEGYLDTDYQFLVKKDSPDIKTLEELKGKTLSVNKGSIYDSWARANQAKYGFEVESFATQSDAVQALTAGRVDANLAGNTVVQWAAQKVPALKPSYTIKTGLVWAVALRKDDSEMRNRIDEAIECMKTDGTLPRLVEKWFQAKPEPGSTPTTPVKGHGVPDFEGYDATEHQPKCG